MTRAPASPMVSVLICSFNRFGGLQRALASVRAQTVPPHQVIVVDDGSTDRRYRQSPPTDVLWIRADPSSRERCGFPSLGYVKNLGLARASGDYVAFLDDDDEWLPTKLERQLAALAATGCRMVSSEAWRGAGRFNPGKKYPRYLADWARLPYSLPAQFTQSIIERENLVIHSSVLIERALVRSVGGYEEWPLGGMRRDGRLLVEDWELWKKCLQATDCAFVPEPLLYYDGRPGPRPTSRVSEEIWAALARFRSRWEEWWA